MQMTWVGAPTLYYGDEAGVCGWTDPDNRRSYPWGREDNELIRFHKEMIRIHRDYQVFKTGSMLYLHGENGDRVRPVPGRRKGSHWPYRREEPKERSKWMYGVWD